MVLLTLGAIAVFIGGVALNFFLTVEAGGVSWSGQGFPGAVFATTAAVMFAGIVFGCLYRNLKDRSGDVHLGYELVSAFKSAALVRALCVSPFVFMSVYALVADRPGDPASYLLAFQNGFFCQALFEKAAAKQEAGV